MSTLPPSLSVTVNTKRKACVIDTTLALSRYGLLLTQRLGDEFDLWLARELWQILDNTQYYVSNPQSLMPVRPGPGQKSENVHANKNGGNGTKYFLKAILNQWDMARMETDLAGLKVFWIGDAMSESLLPKSADQNLVHRFETLAGSLDVRIKKDPADARQDNIFIDCFRDAVALTAALVSHKGFILTRQCAVNEDLPENEPVICSYLRKWGIPCYRVGMDQKVEIERAFLFPIFARAGVTELLWAGLNLAVVHLCVPDAIIMPVIQYEEDAFDRDLEPFHEHRNEEMKDWWKNSVCFWYPL
ncbi:MAG: hypothetical protein MRJ65_11940 [Candidatus Brocadiaceae bacterium]|nr:hypothetical protein [Candidatus Brocadiaceae bacterium]